MHELGRYHQSESIPWLSARRVKTMKSLCEFFRRKDHALSLKLGVASALKVVVSIRGLEALLHSGTAVVMRKGYETFVIQDASADRQPRKRLSFGPCERHGVL
jgi:hypothetical protein